MINKYAIKHNVTLRSYLRTQMKIVSKAIVLEWIDNAKFLGKRALVEKTPKHIHAIERVTKILPNAKIIVMKRNPLDNCASLYKRFND